MEEEVEPEQDELPRAEHAVRLGEAPAEEPVARSEATARRAALEVVKMTPQERFHDGQADDGVTQREPEEPPVEIARGPPNARTCVSAPGA